MTCKNVFKHFVGDIVSLERGIFLDVEGTIVAVYLITGPSVMKNNICYDE